MKPTTLFTFLIFLLTFSCGAITIQNADTATTVTGADGKVVVNTVAPKYTLNEAIEVCIKELEQRGEAVTAGAVKNRLQRMPKSDVDLNVKGLSRTVREVIEAHEAANKKAAPAPDPANYETREKFIAAYQKWKTDALTNSERGGLRSQIGGEARFKREARDAADKIWKEKMISGSTSSVTGVNRK